MMEQSYSFFFYIYNLLGKNICIIVKKVMRLLQKSDIRFSKEVWHV